jgi:hypothetical protein
MDLDNKADAKNMNSHSWIFNGDVSDSLFGSI